MTLDPNLILGLFNVFAPIVTNVIRAHQDQTGDTSLPTNDEMIAILEHNMDGILAEGAAWRMTHPDA